jgi:hypothetical protein
MTVMYGCPDTVFYTILILQILCLALLARFVLYHDNLRHRVLVPVLALAGTGIAGGILNKTGPDMGGILLFMVPTLAVLTLFPLFEPFIRIRRKGVAIAFLSAALTGAVFYYLLGMAFGGVGIFLPVAGISLFSGVWFEVRLVSVYTELLMLGGTLLGILLLGNELAPALFRNDPDFVAICCLITGIAAALCNSLATGFFAVFAISILSGIRSGPATVLIPAIGAAGISFVLSALPVTYQYADVASRYDPSLYILVLVALGVVTILPQLPGSMKTREGAIVLYATATITTIILALLYRSPAQDLFPAVTAGISTIAGSGLVMPGTGLIPGFARVMGMYAAAAVIAVMVCPAVRRALSVCYPRRGRSSPSEEDPS